MDRSFSTWRLIVNPSKLRRNVMRNFLASFTQFSIRTGNSRKWRFFLRLEKSLLRIDSPLSMLDGMNDQSTNVWSSPNLHNTFDRLDRLFSSAMTGSLQTQTEAFAWDISACSTTSWLPQECRLNLMRGARCGGRHSF
jgi:hypothetical protein